MDIDIGPLRADECTAWLELAICYKAFYQTDLPVAQYEKVWRRLLDDNGLHGLGARVDGKLVGIAHYVFQPNVWLDDVCYLQDLYVDEAMRGKGVARALIGRVAEEAAECGASRLYWMTKEDNQTARALYDKLASFGGFIRYDYPLSSRRMTDL